MTQDEIIDKLLFQAGANFGGDGINYEEFDFRKFAKLVAAKAEAKEREACIEACRKTITSQRSAWGANFCIEAIRARGQGTPERGQA
jgi:hypothetical protein